MIITRITSLNRCRLSKIAHCRLSPQRALCTLLEAEARPILWQAIQAIAFVWCNSQLEAEKQTVLSPALQVRFQPCGLCIAPRSHLLVSHAWVWLTGNARRQWSHPIPDMHLRKQALWLACPGLKFLFLMFLFPHPSLKSSLDVGQHASSIKGFVPNSLSAGTMDVTQLLRHLPNMKTWGSVPGLMSIQTNK